MHSVMSHNFSRIPSATIPRAQFRRSSGHKTTFSAGSLVPIYVDEVLPGDTFNLKMTAFARLATPIYPVMDNMYFDTQFFFVPMRLIWENWERFNGAQDDPTDSTDFTIPTRTNPTGVAALSLFDYLGLPTGVNNLTFNALPLRAYNLIWNEWYRDENIQNSAPVPTDDGPDDAVLYFLLSRNKRHDYFTSCLPSPQKGPSVELPLGTTAPVLGIGKFTQVYTAGPASFYETSGTASTSYANYEIASNATADTQFGIEEDPNNPGFPAIYTDLSAATAATINQLRQSFQVQKLLERDMRGGTRYTEIIRSHFGVNNPADSRLQRPEYLGGGTSPININPVAQTAPSDATSPQGNLAAFGTFSAHNHGFVKSFVEHGYIIGLCSVRADLTYQQGLHRMWSRSTRYDFYWPVLSHIGEQSVLLKEIYFQGTSADNTVFGYQERYAEYRYGVSKITGAFRSNYVGSLDAWHLSQDFASAPGLTNLFITESPPMARIKAVTTEPDFIFDSFFDVICARPMPMYGVPGLVDHF